jgi:putative molybdopterin biosynthesis protein
MSAKRTVYLEDIPMDEAIAHLRDALSAVGRWAPFPGETVPLSEALGRVTAEPVWAAVSAPHYHASAMDGYAVRAHDTEGATETSPVALDVVEDDGEVERANRPARPVNTGHAMPPWANAVIMVEHVQAIDDGARVEIRSPVAPWKHVRSMGEDMVATELVLPANHKLRPVDLGAIAGSGHARATVRRKPRVAVIPTGSELVSVDDIDDLRPGDIIEYNSLVLAAQVETWGGHATRWPIVPDEFDAIKATVADAAKEYDLVLVNAGSSAGTEDYTAQVVSELGELLVHGVAVRPGHPVIFGIVGKTPIIGVPGYPVSATLTGEIFIQPLIARWLGTQPDQPPTVAATMSRKVQSPTGDDEFMRVTVGQVGERTIATPLSRGAGIISSLVRADGIVRIPRFSEGLNAGDEVTVELYRHPAEIANTILAIGSHDMTLDLLAQFLAEAEPHRRLTSANVGSLGGLVALKRGQAHLAGAHLLDPGSGEYNRAYVAEYLPGQEIALVTLVGRTQGLIVAQGNPKDITSFEDLARDDVRFVNRQRGSGTRLLLDYELDQRGVAPDFVAGYDREEYTHLATAAAVASEVADCGLGVLAAARALGLGFVPLADERYDLVIPQPHFSSPLLAPLLDLLHANRFKKAVAALPGYDVGSMGNVVEP